MASMQGDTDYYRHRRLIGWGFAGLLLLIGVAVLVGAVVRATIGPTAGYGGFFFFPFGFFFFPFGFFFFLFFLFFVFGWFRWWGWGGWRGYPMMWGYHDSAAEILRRRYARGEISKDQFDQMMRDIEQSRTPHP